MESKPIRLLIVTPVLNDWACLRVLVSTIAEQPDLAGYAISILAVDDGSTHVEVLDPSFIKGPVREIEILKLRANVGHQRAIALGLAHARKHASFDVVVVMDSDGEDRPEDIGLLLCAHEANPGHIIVARRAQRSEGVIFRTFYQSYKFLFRRLTGKSISFGNFSLIPCARVDNVVHSPGVWNNFAATLLRCRIPIQFVPTKRGTRYHGVSTMSFTTLMLHGMSAISVFSDIVIGRIIVALVLGSLLFVAGVGAIIYLRYATNVLVPGYATTVILILSSILINALTIGFLSILTLLASRSQVSVHPTQLVDMMVDRVIRSGGSAGGAMSAARPQ